LKKPDLKPNQGAIAKFKEFQNIERECALDKIKNIRKFQGNWINAVKPNPHEIETEVELDENDLPIVKKKQRP